MESGKLDESEDYLRESLEIHRHSLHEKHPNTAMPLQRLGECLMRKGKDEEAEKLLSEAVDIQRVSLPQNRPDKISTFMSWSKSLSNIADYTRAHHALLESLQIININKLPSNSFERLEVNRLLKRLSAFQQQQHEETIIPEEKEGIEETDASHNSGSEWLKLVAKSLTGEAVELKAKSSDTVATLKRRLQTKDDPSSWDQLLVLNKKQLNDEQTLADAGVTDGTILSVVLCPRGVTGMGANAGELFVRALSQGAVEVSRVKIVIVGKDRTGKTSFKRSLLKQKFQIIEPSTPVAMAELAVCEASNWRLVNDKDQEFLDKHIARAAMHAKHDSSANVSGSEGESQYEDGRADWPHLDSRVDLDSTVGRESTSTDTRESYVDEVIVLTEGIARAIRDFQSDPDLLKKEDSKVHVTIWDLGGQEPLLPGQGQAITSGCVVCVVFNVSQFLGDKAKSFYFPSADSEPIPMGNHWIETNHDAVSLWASMTFLAGDDDSREGLCIGKSKDCASPVMFLIGTHVNDADEEMIKQQNKFLTKAFRNKAFKKHILRPSDHRDDWFFCVENSVSDPDSASEDAGVSAVKRLIEEMARDVSLKRLIPATWSVLEKILDALEQKLGSALSNVHVIMVFARRLCRMSEEKEVRAALAYLDEAGSVIFPHKSEKLKNIVVTKPSWIFMVFSVVASVTTLPPPLLSEDWDEVRQKGIASWKLIDHRLKKAGVKHEEYEDVLNLLNFFFIVCPKLCLSQSSVPYEMEYFIPCLLEVESEGPFAAANSVASNPMSLIVLSRDIEFIPEQLHFRLMTCCIERYSDEPMLTRNQSVYRVEKDVKLELIYHLKKYIIVTIDTKRPLNEVASLCTDIRLFITKKLHEVKTPGLPQFQFSLNIQHPGPAIPVDVSKLVCIDKYIPSEDKTLRRNIKRDDVSLDHSERVALDCWFYDEKDDVLRKTQEQSLTTTANRKCTEDDIVNVANQISGCWKTLVLNLSPTFFMSKTKVIEKENRDDCFMQAVTALNMWTNEFGNKASQAAMIKAMCNISCRSQAEDVFSSSLVEHVYPHK
ncbi:uncharacterized protein LOC134177004 [Corticium candelabrum]|uniref:uncharacterized protein LOC134177004 n=1 Tax=Corticium candelabrum TaxID=121492 RepID=UPI002E2599D3|nr:uncharacterized protein LOC134177004 [Corticium candelabrum]